MRRLRAASDATQSREQERAGKIAELGCATRSLTVAALHDLAGAAPSSQCLNRYFTMSATIPTTLNCMSGAPQFRADGFREEIPRAAELRKPSYFTG